MILKTGAVGFQILTGVGVHFRIQWFAFQQKPVLGKRFSVCARVRVCWGKGGGGVDGRNPTRTEGVCLC